MKIMSKRILLLATSLLMLGGCLTTGYTLVPTGTQSIDNMSVNAGAGWNLAPRNASASNREHAQTWTQDGLLLNRMSFVPAVPDGSALWNTKEDDAALPVFRKGMLPNEIEELVESSIVKSFGEGQSAVSTSNLRPHKFGEQRGFMFDLTAIVSESPTYKGIVGAFVAADELYIMWYIGADPYYFDKHLSEAEAIIRSARIVAAN
jgi:hypothetical protein